MLSPDDLHRVGWARNGTGVSVSVKMAMWCSESGAEAKAQGADTWSKETEAEFMRED